MKFSVDKNELERALSIVSKGLGVNSTLPVLSGILFKVSDDNLTLEATNLDFSCKSKISCFVEEGGEAILPGKLTYDIVRSCEEARLCLQTDDTQAKISCDAAFFSTSVLNNNEFPEFPTIENKNQITFSFEKFQNLIKKVKKFTSKDQSKGVFNGVYFEAKGSVIRAVATDSYRIAISEERIENNDCDFDVVIPSHFLDEIVSMKADEAQVTVGCNDTQVVIEIGNSTFVNRKLEGTFPEYRKLINFDNETSVIVEKDKLISAIKRMNVLRGENTPLEFRVDTPQNKMQVAINSVETGQSLEDLEVKTAGENVEIKFDGNYIMEGLSIINSNCVAISFSSSKQPAHFYPCLEKFEDSDINRVVENKDNVLSNKYLYLVMPVFR